MQQVRKSFLNYYSYNVGTQNIFNLVQNISTNLIVEYVGINVTVKGGWAQETPNGGNPCSEWYNLTDAWAITHGSPNIKVAVIDAGFDLSHPDIGLGTGTNNYSNFFTNTGEIPNNQIDDDGNGYIDDVQGWDFLYDNGNVTPNAPWYFYHGTAVTGLIAEKGNANLLKGVAGGNNGKGVQIIPIKILDKVSPTDPDLSSNQAIVHDAICYAVNMGANIINMSFYTAPQQDIEDAIDYAKSKGVIMVVAAGNEPFSQGNTPPTHFVKYPASNPNVFAISATEKIGNNDYADLWGGSDYGPEIDFASRGRDVCVLYPHNDPFGNIIEPESGTSLSAPFVSGIIALMLSTNPCLSSPSVFDILKSTALKLGQSGLPLGPTSGYNYNWDPNNPGHSQEYGWGVVDGNRAVKIANYMYTAIPQSGKDLYMKDNDKDYGITDPNINFDIDPNYTPGGDQSPDIWVRNNNDDGLENQDPEYTVGQPVWVYVRVRNKGCIASNFYDNINLYWSKASSWSSWPNNWNGSNPTLGNFIGSYPLGNANPIEPGGERIYKFPWYLDAPIQNNGWKSCLLAVINSPDDPYTDYPNRLDLFIQNNNNVAIRNETIVDIIPGKPHLVLNGVEYPYGGFMYLSNALSETKSYNILLNSSAILGNGNLTREAEVTMKFEEQDWNYLVERGILNNDGIAQIRENEIVVKNPNVVLHNIELTANQMIPVYVGFSFLTDSITDNNQYKFQVSQAFVDSTSHILGSENYVVKKYVRSPFQADAGPDKTISINHSTTLSAVQIPETATYNWYDAHDSLIHTGKDVTVSPVTDQIYKLEVIAEQDGFKDYDEVAVKIRTGSISSLYPNPVSNTVNMHYELKNVTSAYLMILQPYGTTSDNVTLNVQENDTSIDMSNYASGVYNFILICDGNVMDVKSIQKQ